VRKTKKKKKKKKKSFFFFFFRVCDLVRECVLFRRDLWCLILFDVMEWQFHGSIDGPLPSTPSFPGTKRKKMIFFFFFFFFFFPTEFFFSSRLDCRQVGQQVNVNGDQITCRQQDILDQATKNVLLRVLQDMKTYVGELLYIVRADSISIGGRWCFDPNIDISRYGASSSDAVRQQADVMMMVTAWPTAGNTVAWAGACRSDQFGRSIAGHMNYGPGAVGGRSYKMIYTTALHELFHALGFSGNRFHAHAAPRRLGVQRRDARHDRRRARRHQDGDGDQLAQRAARGARAHWLPHARRHGDRGRRRWRLGRLALGAARRRQ
jgi:hypothetical protein